MTRSGTVAAAVSLAATFVAAWTVAGLGAGIVAARYLHRNVTQPKEQQ